MAKGQGSKYKPEYCGQIVEYFQDAAEAPVRDTAPTVIEQEGDKSSFKKTEVRRICAELPTLEGFAVSLNVASTTLRRWTKDHEEFAVAYAAAKDIQFRLLLDRGLTGQYEASAFQFVMKNIAGWTDPTVVAGDPDNPIATRLILIDAGALRQQIPARPMRVIEASRDEL